jgi:hypothetical protein
MSLFRTADASSVEHIIHFHHYLQLLKYPFLLAPRKQTDFRI